MMGSGDTPGPFSFQPSARTALRMEEAAFADAERLISLGRLPDAIEPMVRAAQAGDARAIYQLALWRLIGDPLPRDLRAARSLLRGAAGAGHPAARLAEVALTANGTGAPADWQRAVALLRAAAEQDDVARHHFALVEAMALTDGGTPATPPACETLCERCSVVRFPALFSAAECRHLAEAAEDLLEPAMVVDPASRRQVPHPVRTSDGAVIGPTRETLVVRALNHRIAMASGMAVDQGEPLAILRYAPGQQYRPHLDSIAGARNQRVRTVLIYLNDGFAGGETHFPELGLTVEPRLGDAIMFDNVHPDGRPDARSRHAGLPVTRGEKWLATRWIRAGRVDPWDASTLS